MLSLSPEELASVKQILAHNVPQLEVWAFGSRLNTGHKKTADLDLALVSQAPLTLETLGVLQDAFSASNLPFRVDLVDFARASDSFKEIIRKQYLVVQAAT